MASFDAAIGFDASTMNAVGAAVYRKVYPQVFTGQQNAENKGITVNVQWNVQSPPTFDLSPISNGEALVRSHLLGYDAPQGVSKDEVRAVLMQTLAGTTFVMNLSNIALTMSGGGSSGTATAAATVYVQVATAGNSVSFTPIKATATTPSPLDQWLLNTVVVPAAMNAAKTLLQGIQLPPLTFSGVSLGPPSITITAGHVVLLSNLAGGAPPDPSGFNPPNLPLFVLISPNLRQTAANVISRGFTKSFGTSGSIDMGITHANYGANANLNSLSLGLSGNPTQLGFNANVSGNVNAGVVVGCSTVGVNYNLSASPNPSGTVQLSMNGATLHAQIAQVNNFVIVISPTGNPLQWILSALTDPLVQTLVAVFSPQISGALNGFGFDLVSIPAVPITVQGFTFQVTPSGLSLGDGGGGNLLVQGSVAVQ